MHGSPKFESESEISQNWARWPLPHWIQDKKFCYLRFCFFSGGGVRQPHSVQLTRYIIRDKETHTNFKLFFFKGREKVKKAAASEFETESNSTQNWVQNKTYGARHALFLRRFCSLWLQIAHLPESQTSRGFSCAPKLLAFAHCASHVMSVPLLISASHFVLFYSLGRA